MTGDSWSRLTPREIAVLAAVERRLSNTEIAGEFHLSVRTVESHIASLRRKLDADSRASLITAARTRRGTAVRVPQNSFVGRDDHLDTVRELLDRERWVTVVGAAGSGKTRLALELAAAGARTPVVAELEHATASEVVNVIAKAVGLGADSAAGLVTACAVALRAQPYLLVVDNCDRVADAVGDVIDQLLVLAGSLTVLATSRSPIGRSGETVYQLPPLPVDEDDSAGAVRLFLDRARSAAPTLEFSDSDDELVARICRRLDGLPLAIELAAARVRHLPLAELEARLAKGFGPLDHAGRSSRHRTLATAFGWTWDLLDDDEQAVLSRMAALPRTFDLELAEVVAMPGAGDVVLRLLDRSLVTPSAADFEPRRFRLLESLRAFVLDRTSPAVVLDVRRKHAAYHAELAARLAERARMDDSRRVVDLARYLCPEVNAALNWTIAQQHPLAMPLARSLAVGVEQYGPDIDSLDALDRAARDPDIRKESTATDLLDLGIALCYGDLDLVSDLAAIALDLGDDGDGSALAAHHLAGIADAYMHRGTSALAHLDLAEKLADERLDLWKLASVRQFKGIALRGLNDPEGAIAAFESAMQTYALAGDAMHVNNARYMMASTAVDSGRHTRQAISWAEQCVEYARESGNQHELAHALLTRAALSDGPDADTDLPEVVETFRTVGDLRCLTRSCLLLARLRPAIERAPLLEQALEVSRSAHDPANQVTALERLIQTHWETGAHRVAVTYLGALTTLVGYDDATASCPDAMVDELDHWQTALAEGRARWPVSPASRPTNRLASSQTPSP